MEPESKEILEENDPSILREDLEVYEEDTLPSRKSILRNFFDKTKRRLKGVRVQLEFAY
jgi:hypothetical protein